MGGPPLIVTVDGVVEYPSNTALYAAPDMAEGVDYVRQHRAHGTPVVILAPHGGGIEPGTSELCLEIAGADPGYDYWMLEGLRAGSNAGLHVASVRCDDPVAVELCARADRALGVHGCLARQAGLPAGSRTVLVGGLDADLRRALLTRLRAAGFEAADASAHPRLGGRSPRNIVNRTRIGAGAQLELPMRLREAMFAEHTRRRRRYTQTPLFHDFVGAVRIALAQVGTPGGAMM
jgi:phage replication-related protein YjqB (UPF0714/DUF867 family)